MKKIYIDKEQHYSLRTVFDGGMPEDKKVEIVPTIRISDESITDIDSQDVEDPMSLLQKQGIKLTVSHFEQILAAEGYHMASTQELLLVRDLLCDQMEGEEKILVCLNGNHWFCQAPFDGSHHEVEIDDEKILSALFDIQDKIPDDERVVIVAVRDRA